MSLYRCAVCGSGNVLLGHKRQKRKKKGMEVKIFYQCRDCGKILKDAMPNAQKESIDKYLKNPAVYKAGLQECKLIYKNIEWEEGSNVKSCQYLEIPDIERILLAYLKEAGSPVPLDYEEIANKINLDYKNQEIDLAKAVYALEDCGLIKTVLIGGSRYLACVTDRMEKEDLILRRRACAESRILARGRNYRPVLEEMFEENLLKLTDIYEFLKENNELPEEVIRAAESNCYIPLYFARECVLQMYADI